MPRTVSLLRSGRLSICALVPLWLATLLPALGQPPTVATLNADVKKFLAAGKYSKALPLATNAVYLAGTSNDDPTNAAAALQNLADLSRLLADYAKAEELYRRCLKIRQEKLGPNSPETAETLCGLGELNRRIANYDAAETLQKTALRIDEAALGTNHVQTADVLHYLGLVYYSEARYPDCESCLRRSLDIFENELGANDPKTAWALAFLGELFREKGEYLKAEPLLLRAMSIDEAVLGKDHPDTADTLAFLGALRTGSGYTGSKTGKINQRALKIREDVFGLEHPETAIVMGNEGVRLAHRRKLGEAENWYLRAWDIEKKTEGPQNPSTLLTALNLGNLYVAMRDPVKAEPLIRGSVEGFERVLGSNHNWTARAWLVLTSVLYATDRRGSEFATEESLLKRALEVEKQTLGTNSVDTANVLRCLAVFYKARSDLAKAGDLFLQAQEMTEVAAGSNAPITASRQAETADFYRFMEQPSKAAPLYERALAIQIATIGPDEFETRETFKAMETLYSRAGDWKKLNDLRRGATNGIHSGKSEPSNPK